MSERIDEFFAHRIDHNFIFIESSNDESAFMLIDSDSDRPFIVVTSDGINQYPYRSDAQRFFNRAVRPIRFGDFLVVCRNNKDVETNFDLGIEYLAKFHDGEEEGFVVVWDRFGEEIICKESRFNLPVGYMVFRRVLESGEWNAQRELKNVYAMCRGQIKN